MNRLWVIDDEQEILDILKFILELEGVKNYELILDWDQCKPNKGDVVLHDIFGIGEMPKPVDGVNYFSHSGSTRDGKKVDFVKPCDMDYMIEVLIARLELNQEAA